MGSITVGVIGSKDYSRNIGKKGTSSDITLYNLKSSENVVTAIEPSSYPDKLSSLFYSLSLSDFVVFVVESVDADFAESVMAIDALGKEKGVLITTEKEKVSHLIKGTQAEKYRFIDNEPIALREMLLEIAGSRKPAEKEGGSVVIDHFFKVKGVGTVILGIVTDGCVRKHEEMTLFPLKKEVQVRSIQKQDVDCDIAYAGDRVGLALKGIEPDELDRGFVLSSEDLECAKDLRISLDKNKFFNREIRSGNVLHTGCGMQFAPVRVDRADGNELEISFEKDIVMNHSLFISQLDAPRPRVVGSARIVKKI